MWLGFAICSFSFLCSILLVYLDWRQDILIQMKEIVSSNAGITAHNEEEEKSIASLKNLPKVIFLNKNNSKMLMIFLTCNNIHI